mmetsp:Transcript_18493/g.51085  ORF Transcript_18493/g.51085 Transcript_18493/m.51085 type:complete len:1239 (-) Transcript_18493:233-3949(-)
MPKFCSSRVTRPVSVFLGFFLISSVVCVEKPGWSIVIDAGSSGSRVHVYKLDWSEPTDGSPLLFPNVDLPEIKWKSKPGLSSFAKNPEEVGESLNKLVRFAKKKIPEASYSTTPLILSATAGLRMLEKSVAEKILDNCYTWLKAHSPFIIKPDAISMISGHDEGAYGWLTINFLSKRLHGMSQQSKGTLGTIEMGGASTQVTFEAPLDDAPSASSYKLEVGDATYILYTHSYLGYGQDQARASLNNILADRSDDPCMPVGFTRPATADPEDVYFGRTESDGWHGTGLYNKCARELRALFKTGECSVEPCSFNGVHQPHFWESGPGSVVLVENFYHTAKAVGIPGMAEGLRAQDYEQFGKEYCGENWDALKNGSSTRQYPDIKGGSESKYCFSLAYIVTFLKNGLGVPSDFSFPVLGSVDGVDLEWTLGRMLHLAVQDFLPSSKAPSSKGGKVKHADVDVTSKSSDETHADEVDGDKAANGHAKVVDVLVADHMTTTKQDAESKEPVEDSEPVVVDGTRKRGKKIIEDAHDSDHTAGAKGVAAEVQHAVDFAVQDVALDRAHKSDKSDAVEAAEHKDPADGEEPGTNEGEKAVDEEKLVENQSKQKKRKAAVHDSHKGNDKDVHNVVKSPDDDDSKLPHDVSGVPAAHGVDSNPAEPSEGRSAISKHGDPDQIDGDHDGQGDTDSSVKAGDKRKTKGDAAGGSVHSDAEPEDSNPDAADSTKRQKKDAKRAKRLDHESKTAVDSEASPDVSPRPLDALSEGTPKPLEQASEVTAKAGAEHSADTSSGEKDGQVDTDAVTDKGAAIKRKSKSSKHPENDQEPVDDAGGSDEHKLAGGQLKENALDVGSSSGKAEDVLSKDTDHAAAAVEDVKATPTHNGAPHSDDPEYPESKGSVKGVPTVDETPHDTADARDMKDAHDIDHSGASDALDGDKHGAPADGQSKHNDDAGADSHGGAAHHNHDGDDADLAAARKQGFADHDDDHPHPAHSAEDKDDVDSEAKDAAHKVVVGEPAHDKHQDYIHNIGAGDHGDVPLGVGVEKPVGGVNIGIAHDEDKLPLDIKGNAPSTKDAAADSAGDEPYRTHAAPKDDEEDVDRLGAKEPKEGELEGENAQKRQARMQEELGEKDAADGGVKKEDSTDNSSGHVRRRSFWWLAGLLGNGLIILLPVAGYCIYLRTRGTARRGSGRSLSPTPSRQTAPASATLGSTSGWGTDRSGGRRQPQDEEVGWDQWDDAEWGEKQR